MTNNPKERIKEQLARYHSDDPTVSAKAVEEILDDYKKFITHIINKHFYSYKNQWYEDMFSVGVIGLIESLSKYDPDKSMPTTHFARYIIHEIYEFLATFVNKTTTHYAAKLTAINRAIHDLEAEGIENPTVIDISMKTGIKPEIILKALSIQTATQSASFESEEFLNSKMTDFQKTPDEVVEMNEGISIMFQAIDNLPKNMKGVVLRRNGLGGYEVQSNDVISRDTGIPTNQIRRIYAKALALLRESDMKYFFADNYARSATLKEPVPLVPEDTATRMITAIVAVDIDNGDMGID